jgi:hypothetical protein
MYVQGPWAGCRSDHVTANDDACPGGGPRLKSGVCDHPLLMAETPDSLGLPDPDLNEPGEPIHATLELEDGTQMAYEIPQTKRDNCIALSARAGGEQYVTRSMVEAHPYLTWRDFNFWIAELLEYQKERDWYWDMLKVFSRKFDLPETYSDRLGLRHLTKDES